MKNYFKISLLTIVSTLIFSCTSSDNTPKLDVKSFLDGNTFILDYYLVDNKEENFQLQPREIAPQIKFYYNNDTKQFECQLGAFCNGSSVIYKMEESYLKVISRGGTTLAQCDNDDNRFFSLITGNIITTQSPKNVYFKINTTSNVLLMWINENEKLHLTKQ